MAKYIVHKPVELDAILKKHRQTREYYEANYELQPKYDGCNGVAIIDLDHPNQMLSRTGTLWSSCDHILQELERCHDYYYPHTDGLVFIGEVWQADTPMAVIGGKCRKDAPAPELTFVVFDVLLKSEYEEGYSSVDYRYRINRLNTAKLDRSIVRPIERFVEGTTTINELLERLDRDNFDGVIARDPRGDYKVDGDGKGGEIIKFKFEVSHDLTVLGFEEGQGKMAGMAGKVILQWKDGQVVKASGGTFSERLDWFRHPEQFTGLVGEVEGMGYTDTGAIREPRFKGFRYDKLKGEF